MHWVNAYILAELEKSPVAILHNGFDIILTELPSGEQIAIHLMERDIDVDYLSQIMKENAAQGKYTLFMLWAAMLLPEHGERYLPYDWMRVLLDLYGAQIYAFENYGQTVWLFPIHFDPIDNSLWCDIRYGDPLEFDRLHCETIYTEGATLNGRWQVAWFDGERIPPRQQQTKHAANPPRQPTIHMYYEMLGITLTADLEEVKRAYRNLAMQFHPDYNKSEDATAKMQALNNAYEKIVEHLESQTKP